MPTPRLSVSAMQQAVDVAEHFDQIKDAAASIGVPYMTFKNRLDRGRLEGLRPAKPREFRPVIREKLGRSHMVIPDIQAKPGVSNDHLEWIANYALEKRPDVIVQIGDWADMPSLSSYDKGKRSYEGRRYVKDIDAANDSLMRFERVLEDYNRANPETAYNPEKHITLGNHEQRIERATELDAMLDGKLLMSDLQFEDRGWDVHPFLDVVEIDGVEYSHFFISGTMGRPVSSAAALLKARGCSATMGHVQKMDVAYHPQTQRIGLMCGTCYLHDETYLGPQGNEAPRQIVMKNEVEDGRYDLMAVSLRFLKKRYS